MAQKYMQAILLIETMRYKIPLLIPLLLPRLPNVKHIMCIN
jgi:hypothetical protein